MANGHGFHIGLPYNDHDTWSVLQNEALSLLCPGQTMVFSALRWLEQNVERKKWRKVFRLPQTTKMEGGWVCRVWLAEIGTNLP